MQQLFLLVLLICVEETLSDSSAGVQTHHSSEEGCRPFYAFEPCTFTLAVYAYQLNKDVVGGTGLSQVRRGNLQFVLDHCGGLERKALKKNKELVL